MLLPAGVCVRLSRTMIRSSGPIWTRYTTMPRPKESVEATEQSPHAVPGAESASWGSDSSRLWLWDRCSDPDRTGRSELSIPAGQGWAGAGSGADAVEGEDTRPADGDDASPRSSGRPARSSGSPGLAPVPSGPGSPSSTGVGPLVASVPSAATTAGGGESPRACGCSFRRLWLPCSSGCRLRGQHPRRSLALRRQDLGALAGAGARPGKQNHDRQQHDAATPWPAQRDSDGRRLQRPAASGEELLTPRRHRYRRGALPARRRHDPNTIRTLSPRTPTAAGLLQTPRQC